MTAIQKSARKTRKKNFKPILWADGEHFEFSEKQWNLINLGFDLSDDTRRLLERTVSIFRLGRKSSLHSPTRADTIKELKLLQAKAEEFLSRFMDMQPQSAYALMDTRDKTSPLPALQHLQNTAHEFEAILKWIAAAVKHAEGLPKGKTGQDTRDFNYLIEQIDRILFAAVGIHVDRSKRCITYINEIFNAAEPGIGGGTIESAIKRFMKKQKMR